MSNDERMSNLESFGGRFGEIRKRSKLERPHYNLVIRICFVTRHSDFVILHIRVHSWLKRKPQHFDGRGDFDVLVADDEI